ncbi:glycoside hydrolase family 127 protein [Muricauda sp. 334s03]|uniref:Glycoside hydrolase family 127 protein n=1 Tax=Flagellimonas yonaguniensis TaxID=3031325 RepID=A0ABT5Y0Y9_9FLAO|nr:beta-L-arabinofuranosidase domain-containing protein [[Muricauda] yonaguniensis]MDF0717105.1 glycoside hydrolase family 127 protein [[Muricauda] yonaguniensis]
MKLSKFFVGTVLFVLTAPMSLMRAQSGNQILDGIGETGMIARYIFDGDAKDWSRNNLHARAYGEIDFKDDEQFKKVLSLPGDGKSYISIPGESVQSEESISIATWVNFQSMESGQLLFDFGKDDRTHFFVAPFGTKKKEGFQAQVILDGDSGYEVLSPDVEIEMDQWVHLALVFDIPSKSISVFVNGKQTGKVENVEMELEDLFTHENLLYLGKSIVSGNPYLKAKIHDFRLYRIPLSEKQITRIRYIALRGGDAVVRREKPEDNLPKFSSEVPQLYNEYLTGVSDVEVETEVGFLPRLPRHVKGTYRDGIEGPMVRVLWPSPTDNAEVTKTGSYVVIGRVAGTDFKPKAKITVKTKKDLKTPDMELKVFGLDQVRLDSDTYGQQTKFIENRDKFINTLEVTNPDSFLYMFRNAFGQEQPEGAKPLGVWDSQETKLRGHATGHYLTAIAQAYASTGYDKELQANFANKMDYMVEVLYELSQMSGKPVKVGGAHESDPTKVPHGSGKATYDSDLSENGIRTDYWNWGEGFISAYPPDQFIMLEKGATYGTQPTQVWAPYYTLHKILAGLMDIYEVSGNKKALEVAKGMGDWVYARLSLLPTDTLIRMWNSYIAGEFGGMNEAMARLDRITDEPRYLKVAQLFDNIKMFFGDAEHSHGLAKNVDSFRGLHANQHIPQIMGALEIYRDSESPEYYRVADNFWYKAKNDYMYSIGGVAGARNPTNAECFIGQPATLYENGFSAGGQNETCATYNMLKLTKNLFLFDQRTELMDYYERGLYNHILASVAEDSPANTYHVPLRPGSVKRFGNADMTGFTCCNGTALESSTKLQNSIYFKDKDNSKLYVNLFVPSTLEWTEKDITVEQKTAFPKEDNTQLIIKGKGKFDLNLRVPQWATKGFYVKVNGKGDKVKAKPGSYVTLSRKWKEGDVIDVQMPFQFHLDPVMDQQNIASLFYGPVLLVAQEPEPRNDWRKVTLDAKDIGKTIKGDPKTLEFTIDGVVFKPFYETYARHSVYLDVTLE